MIPANILMLLMNRGNLNMSFLIYQWLITVDSDSHYWLELTWFIVYEFPWFILGCPGTGSHIWTRPLSHILSVIQALLPDVWHVKQPEFNNNNNIRKSWIQSAYQVKEKLY